MSELEKFIQKNGLAKTESLLREVANANADSLKKDHPKAAEALKPKGS